jgi:uncharacterized membrane protein
MMSLVKEIKDGMNDMKYYPSHRTSSKYNSVLELCNHLHMMIMSGLQQRKMLVRMSESEPKGARSIEHWDSKVAFRKGDLTYKNDEGGKYV